MTTNQQQSQTAQRQMLQRSRQRLIQVFDQRVSSLVEDGYRIRHMYSGDTLLLCRLHHMANGNDIIVKAFPLAMTIVQLTNHVQTHYEQIKF